MRTLSWLLITNFLVFGGFGSAAGQTESKGDSPIDLTWLMGCWEGPAFGGHATECWMSAPRTERYTGMFHLVMDGKFAMSEVFAVDTFEGRRAARLKHFHPSMKGWEEKDEFKEFPFLDASEQSITFDGLGYTLLDDGRLQVDLVLEQAGRREAVTLVFSRLPR